MKEQQWLTNFIARRTRAKLFFLPEFRFAVFVLSFSPSCLYLSKDVVSAFPFIVAILLVFTRFILRSKKKLIDCKDL